ncbi:hypothetical protein [Microbacterium sp. ZW T5_56]|uniref:hypothetical protein n=1 Tax=Microbacterium sp. ZW T5_56 TaxID=3378081 RepID=UPI003851ED85
MIRLIVADLARGFRLWLGLAAVSAAVSTALTFAFGLAAQPRPADGSADQLFSSLFGTILIFTGIVVLIVASSASVLVMNLRRRSLALWQIVGILPGQIFLVSVAQILLTALFGAVVGGLVGLAIYAPVYDYGLSTLGEGLPQPAIQLSSAAGAVGVTAGVIVLAGLRGARSAARTSPVRILREPEPVPSGWGRWVRAVVCALAIAGTVALPLSMRGDGHRSITGLAPLLPALFAAALAVGGPLVYAGVLRTWTALIPARFTAWYLARHSAAARASASTAAIGPVMAAIALVGGLYAAGMTLAAAPSNSWGDFSIDTSQLVLLFGAPLLVAIVGAAAAVYTTGSARQRERALLTAAGAAPGTLLRVAICEAVILVVTSVLLAVAVIVLSVVLIAVAVGAPGIRIAFGPIAMIGASALVLIVVATIVPALSGRRGSVMSALAAE